jgi:hypothetical protein
MPRCQTPLLALGFLVAAVGMQLPALHGEPVSDDLFLLHAPEVQELDARSLREILDPRGPVATTYLNYTPVHALLHAVERQLFGERWIGYHLVNVAMHAAVALLVVAILLRSGIPRLAAWLGGAVFLAHPAQVEAVAWISQLKTTASSALALGALLALPRRPAAATCLFALGLLTKPQVVFALPVAAAFAFARPAAPGGAARDPVTHDPATGAARDPETRDAAAPPVAPGPWRWLALWTVIAGAFALLEAPLFLQGGVAGHPLFEEDRFLHLRTVMAIAARYLLLAATGHGASTLHEPPLATSLGDPWWLAGLAALGLLGARLLATARRRRVEAAFWIWALAVWAPISQVFPFSTPMADRYLFMVLPGLIGGALLAGGEALAAFTPAGRRRTLAHAAAAAAAALALFFALRSFERAAVWRDEESYVADAARHYPDGRQAYLLRAREHARRGDVEGTIAALRAARARGWSSVGLLYADPVFAEVGRDPRMRRYVRELTGAMVAMLAARPAPRTEELQILAQLHLWRGERRKAEAVLERAAAQEGPGAAVARDALAALRARRAGRGAPRVPGAGLDGTDPLMPNPAPTPPEAP